MKPNIKNAFDLKSAFIERFKAIDNEWVTSEDVHNQSYNYDIRRKIFEAPWVLIYRNSETDVIDTYDFKTKEELLAFVDGTANRPNPSGGGFYLAAIFHGNKKVDFSVKTIWTVGD